MATLAARCVLRSARTRSASLAAGTKPKAAPSRCRIPSQKPPPNRILRLTVEMSFAMESMLPYHTATASALLTSMLSVSARTNGWTLGGKDDTA